MKTTEQITETEWKEMYKESIENKEQFFAKQARNMLTWSKPFNTIFSGKFEEGNSKWFEDGKLNACYNAVDRNDGLAMIFQGEDEKLHYISYQELLDQIIVVANYLQLHVSMGDCVTIYMPMSVDAVVCALACARIGVVHTVVFGGFSAESLKLRINDSKSKMVLTAGEVVRANKKIDFLKIAMEAVGSANLPILVMKGNENVVFVDNLSAEPETREVLKVTKPNVEYFDCINKNKEFVECVAVPSEHPLFYLYTSGSTGKPKGIVHSTGGYLLYAMLTAKYCFDIKKNDTFFCTADLGWITGHSYTLYGPLLNGACTVILGGAPTSHPLRIFNLIKNSNASQFYTAPTLIRMLMKQTKGINLNYNFYKLRVLGSVGEPINSNAYKWYSKTFGNDKLPVVDTYWQTESGGIMISPIPNVSYGIPECATIPFLGMKPVIVNDNGVALPKYTMGKVVFEGSWPGISRGIINDMERYRTAYFSACKGYYYTGDEGYFDDQNYFWIRGRADDVLNISGHRLSTAEIESAICKGGDVNETAVVGVKDDLTGQAIVIFVVPKTKIFDLENKVRLTLRKEIGPIVSPKKILIVKELPKTSTGKLMRRVLRSILTGDDLGDLSTCMNVTSVDEIRIIVGN